MSTNFRFVITFFEFSLILGMTILTFFAPAINYVFGLDSLKISACWHRTHIYKNFRVDFTEMAVVLNSSHPIPQTLQLNTACNEISFRILNSTNTTHYTFCEYESTNSTHLIKSSIIIKINNFQKSGNSQETSDFRLKVATS